MIMRRNDSKCRTKKVNTTHSGEMFYWMFESRANPERDPLILWLTGGPGCASDLALLAENGPFLMNETTKELYYNEFGLRR